MVLSWKPEVENSVSRDVITGKVYLVTFRQILVTKRSTEHWVAGAIEIGTFRLWEDHMSMTDMAWWPLVAVLSLRCKISNYYFKFSYKSVVSRYD
jgi:hypothetical protein